MIREDDKGSNSQLALGEQYEYKKVMGSYKPSFEGIPEDYYPLTTEQVVKYSIFVISIIGGTLGLMIGFLFWATTKNLDEYIIIWSVIFLVFAIIMMVLFFVGGKNRITEEKELIQENQKKHQKMASKGA